MAVPSPRERAVSGPAAGAHVAAGCEIPDRRKLAGHFLLPSLLATLGAWPLCTTSPIACGITAALLLAIHFTHRCATLKSTPAAVLDHPGELRPAAPSAAQSVVAMTKDVGVLAWSRAKDAGTMSPPPLAAGVGPADWCVSSCPSWPGCCRCCWSRGLMAIRSSTRMPSPGCRRYLRSAGFSASMKRQALAWIAIAQSMLAMPTGATGGCSRPTRWRPAAYPRRAITMAGPASPDATRVRLTSSCFCPATATMPLRVSWPAA
jgi:hypothetical protein